MAIMKKLHYLLLTFALAIVLNWKHLVNGKPQVPCLFIFGDSLVDAGSNNNLKTTSKANYWPYGKDNAFGPTGRFTNGKTAVDIIAEQLGFDGPIKTFSSDADPDEASKGMNYASASSGILPETGKQAGDNIDFDKQLENHRSTMERLQGFYRLNDEQVRSKLDKCLYVVVIGNDDYLSNYYLPDQYNTSKMYSPQQFATVLIKKYNQQLRQLYSYGARKVGLTSIFSIGCTPKATSTMSTEGSLCVDQMNYAANIFNRKLNALVYRLNTELPGAKFLKAGPLGFDLGTNVPGVEFNINPCCKLNDYGYCVPNQKVCDHRETYFFYDGYHATEIIYQIAGRGAYVLLQSIL